jgi:hypothetical protein
VAGGETHIIHDPELITSQLARLRRSGPVVRGAPLEAVSGTAGRAILHHEIPAGDVEDGIDVEVALVPPELAERDLLGMPEQPGCFMIEGGRPFFDLADP